MYKLTQAESIVRLSDGAFIPADPANTDYRAYQAWVGAGNEPEPADTPDPKDEIRAEIARLEADSMMNRGMRELSLRIMEKEAAEQAAALSTPEAPVTADDILATVPAYVKFKALDDQIAILRRQL